MGQSRGEVSSCCGAPLIRRMQSDPSNFSDDHYDLQVPVWVCSKCHAVIDKKIVKGGQTDATT
jgi:hypothetical protein